jgi:limonene-1,2-epoxide hydrolase
MPTPAAIVTEFLALWERPGGLNQAVRDYFLPTTVWENVGMATTTGIDEAIALNDSLAASLGMAAIRVENLAVVEGGGKVLTERIDHLLGGDGRVLMSAPCMGAFDVAGGKITAWRDYFDTAGAFARQQEIEGATR